MNMNKFVISILCLFLYASTVIAQKTLCLQTMEEVKGVGKTIPKRDIEDIQNGVKVTYHFSNIVLQDDPLYTDATIVGIEGFWPNSKVGEPAVLSRWDTFVVPDAGAKIVIIDSSYVELPMEISPARPILSNSGNDYYSEDNVLPITGFSGYFPSSLISATRNDCYRNQHLLDVCVTPIQYDFKNKKIRVFTMIQYNIQYNVTALRNSLSGFSKGHIGGNTFFENIALNHPFKALPISPKTTTDNISSKYLIVSVPKYATAVNRFAEWKRTLGFDVIVAMTESWDTTLVKNVVHEVYETDGVEYLLIVGGQNDVPGLLRNRNFSNKNHYHPTDLYYGCMNSGYTPDIFRGRLLVNTSDEAMDVVNKIINYEKNPIDDESFYKRGVHCAYFQDRNIYKNGSLFRPIDGYEDRRFVLTSERIRDGMINILDSVKRVYYTEDEIYPTHWNQDDYATGESIPLELMKPTFSWDGDSTEINTCINQRALYVLMRDHGDTINWGDPYYDRNNIGNLNNNSFLPVVFSICCYTGKFDANNCFCESFQKKKNGGCVAIYGATQASLSGPNDVMAEGMFDAIWPSLNLRPQFGIINGTSYSSTPTPTYRLGQILDQGLKRCDEAYLNTSKAWYPRYTSELFHCFGDPSMMIYTEKPSTFSHASIDRQSGDTIYVSTGGILATISFYNRRTGAVHAYTGYSASYPNDPETSVCISAHNMVPYLDEGALYIQNQTLSDGGYYEAKTIKVGRNVTATQSEGNVNFSQGNYHLVGKNIELHPGTTISIGTTLTIQNK